MGQGFLAAVWLHGLLSPGGLLLLLSLHGPGGGGGAAAKTKAPTALEAIFKERITRRLNGSVEAALGHLTARLSLGSGSFSGYELEFGDEEDALPFWRHGCMNVVASRDSVENCAMRQLHALGAVCDANSFVARNKAATLLVKRHLRELASKKVPALGLQCTKFDGVDIWFHRKTPDSREDDLDASPAVQASLLAATVRCADAVGEPQYFQDAESWFMGLQKVYPQKIWNASMLTFHKSGIIWESLSLVASHLPPESTFHAKLVRHVELFEGHLREAWQATPSAWSFSSARALAIRQQSKLLRTKKQRTIVRAWAQEHVDRFLGGKGDPLKKSVEELQESILARIGGAGYTCGPLQGLASLASVLSGPDLLRVVLQLLEKDVDRYQIGVLSEGGPAPPKPPSKALAQMPEIAGAFFRDENQLKMEVRRSIRVDDVAMCAIALTQVLRTLEDIMGVVIDQGGVAGSDSDAKGGSEEL